MSTAYTEEEKWRHRAGIRQGIIAKLEKQVARYEEQIIELQAALEAKS